MNVLAFDTETERFRPGVMAPELVCVSYQRPGVPPKLVSHLDAWPTVSAWFEEPTLFVGQNVAYDMAVLSAWRPELLPKIFKAYDEDRVADTMIRQKLLDIAAGCYRGRPGEKGKWIKYDYSLDALAKRVLGEQVKKEGFRKFYGWFRDVPLHKWPEHSAALQARAVGWLKAIPMFEGSATKIKDLREEWVEKHFPEGITEADAVGLVGADQSETTTYPLSDARITLDIYLKQETHAKYIRDQYFQTRAAWALHLASCWGLRTRASEVSKLGEETKEELREITQRLIEAGLVREDGSRDTKKAQEYMLEVCGYCWDSGLGAFVKVPGRDHYISPRLTDKGAVSLDSDACKVTEDPLLIDYANYTGHRALLTKDIPLLLAGERYPIHARFDLAETGRTTTSNPNIQNFRRTERKVA